MTSKVLASDSIVDVYPSYSIIDAKIHAQLPMTRHVKQESAGLHQAVVGDSYRRVIVHAVIVRRHARIELETIGLAGFVARANTKLQRKMPAGR